MKRTLAIAIAVAAATLLGPVLAAPAATAAPAAPGNASDPAPCHLVTFETAEVVTHSVKGRFTLVVSGMRSATNVTIKLSPLVYFRQPEFWGIEVIGCVSGIGLQVLTPYTEKLDVTSVMGTIGIEVQGADRSVRIPLFPAPAE